MSRLLLKCDGTLLESYSPLDPEPPYVPPDRWDAGHVGHRFAEALLVISRMPARIWPRGFKTLWPQFQSEWADMLSRLSDGGDAYENWCREQNYSVREKPTSIEIMHMETALCWPGAYLRHRSDLGKAFNVCALAAAREVNVEDVIAGGRHHGVRAPSEWHRLGLEGAERIASGLRADQVGVF